MWFGYGMCIISPFIRIKDLRTHGLVNHLIRSYNSIYFFITSVRTRITFSGLRVENEISSTHPLFFFSERQMRGYSRKLKEAWYRFLTNIK